MLALISLGQSPPTSSLSPQAKARVLLIILGVAAIAILALLALTVIRRALRRPSLDRPNAIAKPAAPKGLTPWEQAGRRAAPLDDTDRPPEANDAPERKQ